MLGIQNNSLEVVVCALPRMMSTFLKRVCKTSKFRPHSPGLGSSTPVPTSPMAGFGPQLVTMPVPDYKPAVPEGTYMSFCSA